VAASADAHNLNWFNVPFTSATAVITGLGTPAAIGEAKNTRILLLNMGKLVGSHEVQFVLLPKQTKLDAQGIVSKAVAKLLTTTLLPVREPTAKLKSSLTVICEP